MLRVDYLILILYFFALLALFSCYLNTFEYSDSPDSEVDFGFPGDWKLDHQYTCELSKKLIILKYDIPYVRTLYWLTHRLADYDSVTCPDMNVESQWTSH